ncbi:IPT/TIG domain-containing protein [Microscilla marina]|uniref:IPT/TIG domain protein n=1 Tax=Microscilla marina ATCC 23134 TaxID=313606 RepID=A1ZY34_MICM2|nr:IPT/TIG domain-containing protein [Microscilla marina]EAY24687.1 IPT/TIG domain protein [Microscilla marina ATCC 23134]
MRLIQKQLPWLLSALFLFTVGCKKKEEDPQQPAQTSLSTFIPTSVDFTSVTLKGSISTVGEGGITDHGFVWGETTSPDLNSAGKHSLGAKTEAGAFEHPVTGLTAGKTYHVRAYATDAQGTMYGEDKTFSTTNSPTITEFTPTEAGQGDTVTIKGTNFNATTAETSIKFGTTAAAIIISVSETEIKVVVPSGVTEGANKITATIKGLDAASTIDFIYLGGLWTKKKDFGGGERMFSVGFSIGDKGYICLGRGEDRATTTKNDLWEYNATSDTWTQKANYSGGKRSSSIAFVINQIAFVGLGIDENTTSKKDVWQYNPTTNQWSQIDDFIGDNSLKKKFSFSVGGKGYVCVRGLTDLWEIDTGVWSKKNAIPTTNVSNVFVINDVAYLASAFDKKLWKYNAVADTWTALKEFPANISLGGIVLNGKAYFASSSDDGYVFWEYTPTTDSWAKKQGLASRVSTPSYSEAFAVGDKIYIREGGTARTSVWEFDPTK